MIPSSERIPSVKPSRDPHLVPNRARILLGEDDAEMRDLLATKLRADGHEVIAVQYGLDSYEEDLGTPRQRAMTLIRG